jgi:hypothetical protein
MARHSAATAFIGGLANIFEEVVDGDDVEPAPQAPVVNPLNQVFDTALRAYAAELVRTMARVAKELQADIKVPDMYAPFEKASGETCNALLLLSLGRHITLSAPVRHRRCWRIPSGTASGPLKTYSARTCSTRQPRRTRWLRLSSCRPSGLSPRSSRITALVPLSSPQRLLSLFQCTQDCLLIF